MNSKTEQQLSEISNILVQNKKSIGYLRYKCKLARKSTQSFFIDHPILSYSIRRILISILILFVGLSLVFFLVRSTIVDTQFLPPNIEKLGWDEKQIEVYLAQKMKELGLSGSYWGQLWHFWYNILPFIPKHVLVSEYVDGATLHSVYATKFVYFGVTSSMILTADLSVNGLISDALPYSAAFGIIAIIFSYSIGIPLGMLAAKNSSKKSGKVLNNVTILIYSLPAVVVVLLLYIVPVSQFWQSSLFLSGSIWSKFWPEVTMILLFTPIVIIMSRRYFMEEATNEYARFALSKGVSENKVYAKHISRNALTFIIKDIPKDLALSIFGFSMITETQWNIPGMGNLIVKALSPGQTDPLFILAYITMSSFVIIFASLISDIVMVKLDPRIALKGGKNG